MDKITMVTGKSKEITSRKGHYAIMVILGNQKTLADIACRAVVESVPKRCLLWADSTQSINALVEDMAQAKLTDSVPLLKLLKDTPDKVLGFAISRTGKVVDIIKEGDNRINSARIEQAFIKAMME